MVLSSGGYCVMEFILGKSGPPNSFVITEIRYNEFAIMRFAYMYTMKRASIGMMGTDRLYPQMREIF